MARTDQGSQRRKTYFIEKKFQARFIINFCFLIVGASILMTGVLYFLTQRSNTVAFVHSRAVACSTADFLLPLLLQTLLIVTAVVGIATIFLTLFISHKIAGPLYRLKKVMKALAVGDFSEEFHLRKNDQLQDLAGAFNEMITSLRTKLRTMHTMMSWIRKTSEKDTTGAAKDDLKELKGAVADLEKALRDFKL